VPQGDGKELAKQKVVGGLLDVDLDEIIRRGEALAAFRDSLAIRERLAKIDTNNIQWQRGLSVSYIKTGKVLMTQDRHAEALTAFHKSLAIREWLGPVVN